MRRPSQNCLAMYVHAGGLNNVWFGTSELDCAESNFTGWNPTPSTMDYAMVPLTFLCEQNQITVHSGLVLGGLNVNGQMYGPGGPARPIKLNKGEIITSVKYGQGLKKVFQHF